MNENKPKIRSLKALQAEKARLRASMEESKQQALGAYKGARKKAPAYALKKAAPPAILAGLSAFAFKKGKQQEVVYGQSQATETRQKSGFRDMIFSLIMSLVDNWIDKKF